MCKEELGDRKKFWYLKIYLADGVRTLLAESTYAKSVRVSRLINLSESVTLARINIFLENI